MKLLFLDIDGVLNSGRWFHETVDQRKYSLEIGESMMARHPIDAEAVVRLNRICSATGAKVVISSTWRKFDDSYELEQVLRHYGFTGVVVGATPVLDTRTCVAGRTIHRGYEIENWLSGLYGHVQQYCILDDDDDMLGSQQPNYVRTFFETGLTDIEAAAAIEILNRPWSRGLYGWYPGKEYHEQE